jgi:hypothetical protein
MDMKDIIENCTQAMHEAKNTVGADINEIAFGYYAAGSSWDNFVNAEYAKEMLGERTSQASPEEIKDQQERAKAMLEATLEWAKQNGWEGTVTKVWWTARAGVLSQAVGKKVSSGNPTDILLQFDNDEFLGISAKSTKGKADIGFKNPGVGSIAKALNIDLISYVKQKTETTIRNLNLPLNAKERKVFLRTQGNEALKSEVELIGRSILATLRESLYEHLTTLDDEEVRNHITTYWMDAGANYPYYIKVTGRGTSKSGYSATVSDPIKNEKYKALMSEEISVVKVGSDSIGILAGGKRIMKMRFKYESQKLASSLKMSGDPWK